MGTHLYNSFIEVTQFISSRPGPHTHSCVTPASEPKPHTSAAGCRLAGGEPHTLRNSHLHSHSLNFFCSAPGAFRQVSSQHPLPSAPTRRGPALRTREAGTAGSASQVKKRGGVGTPRQVNNLRLLGIWLEKSRGAQLKAHQVGVPSAWSRYGGEVTQGPRVPPDHPLNPSEDEKPAGSMPALSDHSSSN